MKKGVEVKELSKVFPPKVQALREVSFKIRSGDFFVILGPSGSGKTTLLRIIAGLEVPTAGRVLIDGRTVVDADNNIYIEPKDRNVGMVFQNWALYPHMTAYDNIAFPLRVQRLSKQEIDRRVKEVAEALGIRDLLHRKPGHMSGGQQQRVALARALVKRPQVLLLDEPFSNLDARIRVTAREFVKEIQKELGITTILVTHDQADAFAAGNRIVVLRNGIVQQEGTPKELYESPKNVFVANFIGDPPMNIVKLPVSSDIVKELSLGTFIDSKDENIYIGLRPDDAYASIRGGGDLKGVVRLVEYMGSRKYAKIKLVGKVMVKVLAGDDVVDGAEVGVRIRKLHLFNEVGERITSLQL